MTRPIFLLAIAACLHGCATSPLPTLHSLAAAVPAAEPASTSNRDGLRVVISAVNLPQSLDRPQLLIHRHGGQVELIDGQRWAEPLKRAIPRALAADLMAELRHATVWSAPAAAPARPDIRIAVEVVRFESHLGAESVIEALWLLRAGSTERVGRALVRTPVAGAGYEDLVQAHRGSLRALSRQIAQGLQRLAGQGTP